MRIAAAFPLALTLFLAAPAFADAQQHVQSAKKHERRGEWQKALDEWKAAYSSDVNAEYLIGIGDAYAKLGNKDEARKNYEAYMADPLALPENVAKAKTRLANLDSAGGGLALPGAGLALPEAGGGLALPSSGGGLALPPGDAPSLPALGEPPAAEASSGRKGRKKKGGEAAPAPLTMPGLDLPPPSEPATAKEQGGLALPGLETPKKDDRRVAMLELPGTPAPAKKDDKPAVAPVTPPPPVAVARNEPKSPTTGKTVAMATTPTKPAPTVERKPSAPQVAVADVPVPTGGSQASSGGGAARVVAFVAAGVAVAALGGGALALSKAGAAHSDLTSKVHDGPTAQALLEDERRNKTVSFIGFAGGLAAAGIATALFAF